MTSLAYDSLQILRQDLMIGELQKGRVSRGNGQNTFHVGNLSVWASTGKSLGVLNMEMAFSDINYLTVLVGVVVNMVAGALWCSPLLFANPWMAETGISMEQINENTPRLIRATR